MDQRKELIIKVLEGLQGYRDMADGILSLIKIADLNDEIIDGIIEIIGDAAKSTIKNKEKENLEKTIEKLKKLRKWRNQKIGQMKN